MVQAGSVISQLKELNINSIKIEIQFLDLRDSVQVNIQNWQYPNISEERWQPHNIAGNDITGQKFSKSIKWVLASKKQFILLNQFCKIIVSGIFNAPEKTWDGYMFWLCDVAVNINKLVSNCSDGTNLY